MKRDKGIWCSEEHRAQVLRRESNRSVTVGRNRHTAYFQWEETHTSVIVKRDKELRCSEERHTVQL